MGMPYHVLEEFKKELDPLAAVINYWLKGNVEEVQVCWLSIVETLKTPHVMELGLAEKICAKYCPQDTSLSAHEENEGKLV